MLYPSPRGRERKMSTAEVTTLVPRPVDGLASGALAIQDIIAQKQLIAQAMREVMKEGEHFGVIPGTGKRKDSEGNEMKPRPSLLKPGADTIGFMFRLDADYVTEECVREVGYIYYRVKCILTHIPTGKRVGCGLGSCNSREEKYRRPAPKKCPKCQAEALIFGKEEYERDAAFKGGMFCYPKKGGCGQKFKKGDEAIDNQPTGLADPSDLDNTILKMALKRARIDAILTVTAASDFFTQDVEDLSGKAAEYVDVEVTDAQGNEMIRGALGSAPKGAAVAAVTPPSAATTSREGSGPKGSPATSTTPSAASVSGPADGDTRPTAPKAPRAPSIAHDGTFANHKQVALLHILKSKLGMAECKGDCAVEVESTPKWGKTKTTIQRCPYHAQLAAFKNCDGKPIATSKDLSEDQISNLIDRYEAKIKQQEARAAEDPDIAVIDLASPSQIRELGESIDGDEARINAICDTLRVMSISDIRTKERVSQAIALSLAFGTNSFDAIRRKIMGNVEP